MDEPSTNIAPMPSAVEDEHKQDVPQQIRIGILTVSDTRDLTTDESGNIIKEMASMHQIVAHIVCKDSSSLIKNELRDMMLNSFHPVDVIITNGGTGIGSRDVTIETIRPMFEKEMTAFSHLFAGLSYSQTGSSVMLSRAAAGIYRGKVIFCLPGNPKAVRLAMQHLILPEIGHILKHLGQ